MKTSVERSNQVATATFLAAYTASLAGIGRVEKQPKWRKIPKSPSRRSTVRQHTAQIRQARYED